MRGKYQGEEVLFITKLAQLAPSPGSGKDVSTKSDWSATFILMSSVQIQRSYLG